MSRNPRSPSRSATSPRQPEGHRAPVEGKQWEQMVVELLASGDKRPPDPGKFDDVAIARYLSGGCSSEEHAEIERAMAKSPELSECVALARQVLGKAEAAA
jgi:hypothetical protein